jgi:ribonuclease HI
VCYFSVLFHYLVYARDRLPFIVLGFQMLKSSLPYIDFTDDASCSTQNLASAAWEIYAPTNELISLRGVCLGCTTNNITEYSTVIELLTNVISFGILRLVIQIDSQLVVLQLNNVYAI